MKNGDPKSCCVGAEPKQKPSGPIFKKEGGKVVANKSAAPRLRTK